MSIQAAMCGGCSSGSATSLAMVAAKLSYQLSALRVVRMTLASG